jgi:tripartite-type tricarboxylate transporter receptor subunit TctC
VTHPGPKYEEESTCHFGSVARRVVIAALMLGLFATGAAAQGAQGYPNKTVRIIVAAAPGGTSDILARAIGQELSKKWGQTVVVDNRPGADSNLGADLVAKSAPDGYTLILLDISTLTMGPSLYTKLGYDPAKDFAPITMIVFSPHALFVHPSVPANNVKELIAWGKANPESSTSRRRAMRSGSHKRSSRWRPGSRCCTCLTKAVQRPLRPWPAARRTYLSTGCLQRCPTSRAGKIKGIAVASRKRMEAAPDLPTIIEGGVPDFRDRLVAGIARASGDPAGYHQEDQWRCRRGHQHAGDESQAHGMGADVIGDSPENFAKFLREDTMKWAKVAKEANIKPE